MTAHLPPGFGLLHGIHRQSMTGVNAGLLKGSRPIRCRNLTDRLNLLSLEWLLLSSRGFWQSLAAICCALKSPPVQA